MQNSLEIRPATLRESYCFGDPIRRPERQAIDHEYVLPSNGDFVALLNAYRELGGLARAQEVASMTLSRCGPRIRELASWIVDRQLLSFEWQSQIWIPLFQFDQASMVLHRGLMEVLAVLARTFAPWEQAVWFARPNDCLDGRVPANVLALDYESVGEAARADGLVAAG